VYLKDATKPWQQPENKMFVIFGGRDDYMDLLCNFTEVTTVALPWLIPNSASRSAWSSLTDTSNLLIQKYHEWTADDMLCTWVETPGAIKMKYDAMFNRTCIRNINNTATARSLAPTFLNGKPIWREYYWPNNGNFYPAHFYTDPPSFVFHLHIHREAIVTPVGDVYSRNLKLVLYGCSYDTNPTLPFGGKVHDIPVYKELLIITQFWGTGTFHRMVEIVPRVVVYLNFLKAYPSIKVLAPEGPGGRLGEIFKILGLNPGRLTSGFARAKIAYQPRASGCGFANVPESQMLSRIYNDYIRRMFPIQERNRLILIRRSGQRRFAAQRAIEEVVQRAASEYNLTYTMFIDNPTPSLNDTMKLFHSAVVVVAPHGAGLSNIMFSQPGTYVIEGVCNPPHVNFCFQRLTHILGHHWHGVPSRDGCTGVVNVTADSIHTALIQYLRLWQLAHGNH
jgi:hypothetical protein